MTAQLNMNMVRAIEHEPLWPGIRNTGKHNGIPTTKKLRIKETAYRVYSKLQRGQPEYYIIRHGEKLIVPSTVLDSK